MDHVLEAMQPHYEGTLDGFIVEQRTGIYEKLSDNPYYGELKVIIQAMNILRKHLSLEPLKLKNEIELFDDDAEFYFQDEGRM